MSTKKQYTFKLWFSDLPSYREVSLSAYTDDEAKELCFHEFHQDPYLYPFQDDMKKMHEKLFRVTYEVEGGNTNATSSIQGNSGKAINNAEQKLVEDTKTDTRIHKTST
tara:strand:+ start:266 stop:592 length:327 start_codon:yes stop_codon:yes gene_type:complete